jgi:cell fate regulator YaaT (PSP1 superfamily)
MARVQMIAHRGSERISGICGRLMCCLAYEAEQYKEMLKGMPEIHSYVKTKDAKGQVIEINALKQEIKVRLDDGEIIIVKKTDLK